VKKTFRVTARDIAAGVKRSAYQCPVALALRRSIPSAGDVIVCSRIAIYRTEEDSWPFAQVATPDEVRCFTRDFDGGRRVKPFSFKLDLPL
jgi:hypothetical protein